MFANIDLILQAPDLSSVELKPFSLAVCVNSEIVLRFLMFGAPVCYANCFCCYLTMNVRKIINRAFSQKKMHTDMIYVFLCTLRTCILLS